MKKFILFLLVAFTCIACEPRKEQAYSNVPGYPQAFEIMPKRINTP